MELVKKAENGGGLEVMLQQADLFVRSGFFPKHIDSKEKAVVVMLKGRELGLPFTEALSKISVIQGVATTKVETLLGLARKTGQMQDFKVKYHPNEINPEYCEVTITRKGQSPHTCRFGDQEANSLGLNQRDNYKKQKATMYQWRAIAKNLRVTFPDAIGGLYLEEEISDVVIDHSETPNVTEVIKPEKQIEEAPAKPTAETNEITDDQLGNWVMPKGKFANQRLTQIYAQQNDTGRAVGKEYLEWASEKFTGPEAVIIQRFLRIMGEQNVIDMDKC